MSLTVLTTTNNRQIQFNTFTEPISLHIDHTKCTTMPLPVARDVKPVIEIYFMVELLLSGRMLEICSNNSGYNYKKTKLQSDPSLNLGRHTRT